ncbi:MAG: thiol:disulfide interchange protein DsbG [Thiohalorhabdus sp.]|uniref:thiol:disulfide interchange protein DsbG n=1 Tax=Thiohalorhabdus sp. TaxID=3094134 RepID=UPI00397F7715
MWLGRPGNGRRRSLLAALTVAGALLLAVGPASAQSDSDAWEVLENESHWVTTGTEDPERIVYVFTDPNCPYCHDLSKATKPYYEEGLQVRHILVGILRPSSPGKAAAILGADDPSQALNEHERSYGDGGIDPVDSPGAKIQSRLEDNQRLMQRLGAQATPALVYRDADGEVHMVAGMPRLEALPEILRLPEQPVEDPDLKKYL